MCVGGGGGAVSHEQVVVAVLGARQVVVVVLQLFRTSSRHKIRSDNAAQTATDFESAAWL